MGEKREGGDDGNSHAHHHYPRRKRSVDSAKIDEQPPSRSHHVKSGSRKNSVRILPRIRFRCPILNAGRMIIKRVPRKLPSVFLLMLACTMVWLLYTRGNFTHLFLKRWDCPCAGTRTFNQSPAAEDTLGNSDEVTTRTVIKWLNYCNDENNSTRQDSYRTNPQEYETRKRPESRLGSVYERQEQREDVYSLEPEPGEKVVNPHPFNFILTNSDACTKSANSNGLVDVVSLVHTAPSDTYMRWLIRKTWAGAKKVERKQILTMFLLGQTDPETQLLIELENSRYHDIIQENFTDSYYNLTIKTVMGLKWMAHYCTNARFIIKMDIDMFVNVYNLAKRIDAVPSKEYAEGNRQGANKPIRYKQSKWYTSRNMYSNNSYPPYLNGPAYLMSADLATLIYKMSFTTPFLPWEDAFVGIIMKKLNVDPKYNGRYDSYLNYTNEVDTLRKIGTGITFHLGENKTRNKVHIVNVWKYVRRLNNLPV